MAPQSNRACRSRRLRCCSARGILVLHLGAVVCCIHTGCRVSAGLACCVHQGFSGGLRGGGCRHGGYALTTDLCTPYTVFL